MKKNKKIVVEVSPSEKDVLVEMVLSETATIKAFGLSDKKEQIKYEKLLQNLVNKLA